MMNYLLCCDWGTSSFRLQLIKIADQQIIGEVSSTEGVSNTFNAWKMEEEKNDITRDQFFRQQLNKQINILAYKLSINLDNISIVISGMASSSIGMEEVPYAMLPFPADGSGARIRHFNSHENFSHDIILISGVRSQTDVMRGEETQFIGFAASLSLSEDELKDAVLVFPGTHSKHIFLQNGQLVNFQTFMTGEVFNLMINYSILKQSIETGDLDKFSQNELDAFKLGVDKSQSSHILNSLFTVRTNQLFNKLNKKQNFLYLSGLLIGTELKQLIQNVNCQLILCSASNLFEFYKLAFEELDLLKRTIIISDEFIDKAAIAGQIIIFQNELSKRLEL